MNITLDLMQPVALFSGYPVAMIVTFYPLTLVYPDKLNLRNLINFILPMIAVYMINGYLLSSGMIYRPLPDINAIIENIGHLDVWSRILTGIGCELYPCLAVFVAFRAVRNKHPKSGILLIYGCILVVAIFNYLSILFYKPLLGMIMQQITVTLLLTFVAIHFFIFRIKNRREFKKAELIHWRNLSIQKRLNEIMKIQRPYLNPNMTLPELAAIVGTNRTTLSATIKEMGYSGVRDYLNYHRLREFKTHIENSDKATPEEIAVKVGFSSTSTFYRYFKEKEQMTPAQYIKKRNNGQL